MIRSILAAAVFASLAAVSVPSQAQEVPAAAPAETGAARPSWMEYKPAYSGEENNIANPDRTRDEITSWAQQTAAEVLTFGKQDYNEKMNAFKRYFTAEGMASYTEHLKTSKALDMVGINDYQMSALVSGTPEIVNQGAVSGVFHWILRMPVTISFYQKDFEGNTKTGPTGRFYLFMDVMRVPVGSGDNGLAITRWRTMEDPKR